MALAKQAAGSAVWVVAIAWLPASLAQSLSILKLAFLKVDEEKCTGCGACANACPRHIIELRKKGPKGRRVYVQCVNHDKGAVAKKACSVACIGCGKCQKVCKFDAITIENNVAYVDFNKCRMCTKCVDECPTGALVKVNFPVKKKGGIIMNLRTFRIGGVHPEENKITAEMATQVAPLPKQAIFPLGQHIGAPAKPVVAKGDKVKVGTLIAEAGGFVSAPIYSSVSGTVFKVDTSIDATGYRKPCIIINVEGDEWEESIDRSDNSRRLRLILSLLQRKS